MPFLLAEILNFQGSTHRIGVGSFSKILFDTICLAVTAGMTYVFLRQIKGLGIGTVLAAFTMGKAVGMIGSRLDRRVRFTLFWTGRKNYRNHNRIQGENG